MKKVLLLGDSLRINYQEKVRELLADVCEVVWPDDNCRYTLYTLWNLRDWHDNYYDWNDLALVHWNNGIWDHHRTADDLIPVSTPEQYLYYNRRLYQQLARYTDNLIWATTTPAGKGYEQRLDWFTAPTLEEWNDEIALYNELVSTYLAHQGVAIDDLFGAVMQHPEYLREDGFHLSPAGVEGMGKQVADCIRAHLK